MPRDEKAIQLPRNLYLEVTNRCNLRCQGCIQSRGNWEPLRDMTLQELIMITDQLPQLKQVMLHGIGEPLLNRELVAMIRQLKSGAVRVAFNSNGILLDEEMQNALLDAGLDELRISLDAASAQTYRLLRGSDRFEQIIANLRGLADLLKTRTAADLETSLWFLGTTDNIAELPNFIRLAAATGIGRVHLQRLVYFQDADGYGVARAAKTLVDSRAATFEMVQASQDIAARLGIEFDASGLSRPADSLRGQPGWQAPWRQCYRPTSLMYITANGNVLPCCIAPFATADYAAIVLGNVFQSALAEIWRGPAYRKLRQQLQTDAPPQCCRGCGVSWSL